MTLDQQVDDKGTDQEQARRMLTALRDRGFDGDNEQVAVALGKARRSGPGLDRRHRNHRRRRGNEGQRDRDASRYRAWIKPTGGFTN